LEQIPPVLVAGGVDAVVDPFCLEGVEDDLLQKNRTGLSWSFLVLWLGLDPEYADDVIVQRWQEFTGKAATLEGDGRTFDEAVASVSSGGCPNSDTIAEPSHP
jgi:hypothetical protein